MTKLYYAYHVTERTDVAHQRDGTWLEFHTGSDREEVRQGKSFNHGLQVYSNSTDRGLRFPLKEVFENWETQIDMFNMERA